MTVSDERPAIPRHDTGPGVPLTASTASTGPGRAPSATWRCPCGRCSWSSAPGSSAGSPAQPRPAPPGQLWFGPLQPAETQHCLLRHRPAHLAALRRAAAAVSSGRNGSRANSPHSYGPAMPATRASPDDLVPSSLSTRDPRQAADGRPAARAQDLRQQARPGHL